MKPKFYQLSIELRLDSTEAIVYHIKNQQETFYILTRSLICTEQDVYNNSQQYNWSRCQKYQPNTRPLWQT